MAEVSQWIYRCRDDKDVQSRRSHPTKCTIQSDMGGSLGGGVNMKQKKRIAMEEKKKVYIRSCNGRGSEVINTLKELGATKIIELSGEATDTIYFINHDNHITSALIDSEIGAIIMDNYKEIKLTREPWKDGNILVNDRYIHCYAVFKKYKDNDTFEAYFILDNKNAYFDATASVGHYRLADTKEIEGLPLIFTFLMGALNNAGLCLPKKVE